ncbi:hypothetical protein Fot_44609 [Forsythia ovata]|uniref:Uncharacterized protein n=1 Tax=Forsythia ovata TaxID=205694 RepID=A0ABD1R3Z8_9LAMI
MSGRTRGRPRIEHTETPPPEATAEEEHPPQFATIQQVTVLQDQMSTIMEMLQRIVPQPRTSEAPPPANEVPPTTEIQPAAEIPPAVEIPPSETIQTHEMTSTSRPSIPVNWENILNDKVEEAITRRKSRGKTNFYKGGSVYRGRDGCTFICEIQRTDWSVRRNR